jgi:hypothetical protein
VGDSCAAADFGLPPDPAAVSQRFNALTTAFNLFAMRRGALIVGVGQRPLTEDLRRVPILLFDFASSAIGPILRPHGRNKNTCLS